MAQENGNGKNKLYQLIAVEPSLKTQAAKVIEQTMRMFSKTPTHLDGMVKTYIPTDDSSLEIPPESKQVVTTVKTELDELRKYPVQAIDANLSREETNASGKSNAELSIGEYNFGTLSATSLLALEAHLKGIRKLYAQIPTTDPSKEWKHNEDTGMLQTPTLTQWRTEKRSKPIVLYEATKEHPAQVQMSSYDIQVGVYERKDFTGRITPLQKSKLLNRIDELARAVKKARSNANNTDVINVKVGNKMFDYINQDIV